MANPVELGVPASSTTTREVRPFLYLEPVRTTAAPDLDPQGLRVLCDQTDEDVPALVRGLVNHTIALQHKGRLESASRQPLPMSVLNRRRRAAREWVQAVVAGKADGETLRAVAQSWVPTLAGTGPEKAQSQRAGASCIEFLRGAITALIFDAPSANLLPHARALHVVETVLATHLCALQDAARTPKTIG